METSNLAQVLLIGNPNVGKSVIFNKLTDSDVEVANYTGTTVGFTKAISHLENIDIEIIDVPGTYGLKHTSEAEEVAVKFLESKPTAIIQVLDASHLERNLKLAYEVKRYNIPTIYVLNLKDVAKRQGIEIDITELRNILNAPVIPTIAVKDKGIDELKEKLQETILNIDPNEKPIIDPEINTEDLWQMAEKSTYKVQSNTIIKKDFMEKLGELTLKPWPGIPIAILVLALSLLAIVGVGEFIIGGYLEPFVEDIYAPFITNLVGRFISSGVLKNILVGEYGFLIKIIEWPFALILPYVFLFYLVLTFLEDSGYLPRIGVMMDALLSRLGIQGGNIISLLLGYGCAVPAIISTRASTSKKERLIVTLMIVFCVPCVSQTGAFISLLGNYSVWLLVSVYFMSFVAMFIIAKIADRFLGGTTSPMVLEIPNLLIPDRKSFFRKLKFRMRAFAIDAELPMIFGIALAAIIVESGVINKLSVLIEPLVINWLGLPKEASLTLILGIIRRELAVLPLLEMNLMPLQMFVGSVLALFYIPCLSVFVILIEEFNLKTAVLMALATIATAIFIAGIINHIGLFLLA